MSNFSRDNYQVLIEKLDEFIRKYYINKGIRGGLYFLGLTGFMFLIFSLAEYHFYFVPAIRKGMFLTFIAVSLSSLFYWVILPIFQYLKLGTVISKEQAAQIIGDHFHSVGDKLLNVLQLKQQSFNEQQKELIEASIAQKSAELTPVPFKNAIDLSGNKKYLKYALPPLLLLLLILFIAPSWISESTDRIIRNNTEFEKKAPFEFVLQNEVLKVAQNDDFSLELSVTGAALPNEVFIQMNEYQYRLQKSDLGNYTYVFKNVQADINFRFYAAGFQSREYKLEIMKRPVLAGFNATLVYPAYTGLKPEALSNTGDFTIPQGTKVEWAFQTESTEELEIRTGTSAEREQTKRAGTSLFTYSSRITQSGPYSIFLSNKELESADSLTYQINVIPDQYPSIEVEEFRESNKEEKLFYFAGTASDDYGLRVINFVYTLQREDGQTLKKESTLIKSSPGKKTDFSYIWEYGSLLANPGDKLTYYFEAGDNDGINGSKFSRTQMMTIQRPGLEEIEAITEKNNEDIKETLSKSMTETKKLMEEIKQLREKLLQQKDMDWQRKKDLEKLLEKQKQLEEMLKESQEIFKENKENLEENQLIPEQLQDKQDKLEEIFERVVDPETQELMDKIQELMKELNKDDAMKMMDQMENKNQEKELELDRLMELFKTLEVEYEMQKQAEKLEKLAEEQDKLSNETKENSNKSQEQLQKEQDEINKQFEDLQKKMDEIMEKNEDLERPKDMNDVSEEMDDIKEDLDKAKDELKKQDTKKANKKQKDASKKMKDLAKKMDEQMQSEEMEQMEEDMKALRQLLENLLVLSFEQEDLISTLARVNSNTPAYVRAVQEQSRIRDNFRLVEDSLHALSKRVFQLESFITEKINDVNVNVKSSLEKLEDRKKTDAGENQQRTMKNLNDLALMLNETMEQMQNDMSNMMPGQQMCSKPKSTGEGKGNKNKPMDKITEGQKGVTEEMKKMQEGKENGEMKDGEQSKQFAEIAAKQAALRRALEQLQKEKQQRGQGDQELQEIIDQMNRNEIDLVNKRLTAEMIRRQQDILTRLLDAEKAEREQDWDDKRKAERPGQTDRKVPPALAEYLKKRQAEVETYKTVPASLTPYYKNLVENYYKSLEGK